MAGHYFNLCIAIHSQGCTFILHRSENPVDGDQRYEIYDVLVPQKTEIILDTDSGLGYFFPSFQ